MLPQFKHSLVFFLLLLLSICSATDSFQQLDYSSRKEQRASVSSLQTATATTSITFTPAISIYGGGAATTDTASSPAGAAQLNKRRRWNIFEPSRQGPVAERRRQRRKQRRRALDDEEYQRRKKEWADRYTTLEGLRATFGSNKNKLFGDLDPATTRRLYKSLLPTAVCELVLDIEVRPEELAQLAYEARKAAKLYARERCQLPARLLANWYDGFRALRRYGRFQTQGMSYDQIFDKYYQRSALEKSLSLSGNETKHARSRNKRSRVGVDEGDEWTEEDIVARTCMKILESACRTNPLIDRMTLPENQKRNRRNGNEESRRMSELENLERIAQTLEDDVRKLLDPYNR